MSTEVVRQDMGLDTRTKFCYHKTQPNSALIGKSMSIPRGKREGAIGCKPAHPLRTESASGSAGAVDALRMACVMGRT